MKIVRAVTVAQSVGFFTGIIPDLRRMGYEVISVSSDGTQLQRVRDAGGRTEVVEMERHISPIKDFKSLLKLIKLFRKEKPDMVHSMTPKAGLLCMMAAKITGVPVRVHTFTGLVFPTSIGLKRKILMATDRLTCVCATHIIPEGEGVKKDLLDNGITKKPIKVLGYGNVKGIDLDRFNPDNRDIIAEAYKIRKEGVFTFISIGRLVGDKGINELVEAFERINKEFSNTRLILVGKEEPKLDPLKIYNKKRIEENSSIEAVGQQSNIPAWLAASDCAVLASYREGFPNVVIEAGAMGLPQIVTDINGANEIIIENKNGTIVPSKNTDSLYSAMKRMIEDSQWRETLASNARRLIASRYEQSFVRKCLYDFYHEIMHKND